jgi:hypothetical protein
LLFDLRGRGRRRTIKVIYVALAFLMGGGLVLFGIGGNTSGGLVDAITGSSGGGNTGEKRFISEEKAAVARTQRTPTDPAAWDALVRARVQLATSGDKYNANNDTYTDKGKDQLRAAVAAWNKYVDLNPPAGDALSSLASRMVRVFVALDDSSQAARAQEIIAEDRGSVGAYSTLAILSYQAGETRKGDLAAKKALELAPPDQKQALKGQLDSAKQQSVIQQVAPSPTP